MIKPTMPNIPGMGAMTDTLDFVKNLWTNMGVPGTSMPGMNMPGMNMPGMVMPTLSVEEINKRISDLKAVESWLTLNMNMLRGTIQALEVQAATISTLQTMGENFTATMSGAAQRSAAGASGSSSASNGSSGSKGSKGSNGSNGSNGASSAAHAAEDPHEARAAARAAQTVEPTSKDESDAASLTAPLVNAAAWWNMLQDQFKQAVGNAMASEPDAKAGAASETKAKKPAPKAKSTVSSSSASSASSTAARKRKPAK